MPWWTNEVKRLTYTRSAGGILIPAAVGAPEFQYNVDRAQSGDGMLRLDAGTFLIPANVYFDSRLATPLTIKGLGRERTKVKFIGNFGFRDRGTPTPSYHAGAGGLRLEGMTIDCDQGKFGGTAALWTTNDSYKVSLEDILFSTNYNVGWEADDTYHCNLRRVMFESGYGIVAKRVNSSQAAQYLFDECHWNPDNGILGGDFTTAGEMTFLRCHIQNMLSAASAIGGLRFTGTDSVLFDNCSFEGNEGTSGNTADIILDNCDSITLVNCKLVEGGASTTHDFIRVQSTAPATVGCADLTIIGGSINGANISGRRDYFIQWLGSGTGYVTIVGEIRQTHSIVGNGNIPLITGSPTGVCFLSPHVAADSPHLINKTASATVRNSNDAEVIGSDSTYDAYKCAKRIVLTAGLIGQQRFLFDIKTGTAPTIVYGRIYRNGIALGTEQSDITGAYVTKSEDITQTWYPGDACELWIKRTDPVSVYVRNFRIAYDDSANVGVSSVNDPI